jgi:hypothetical protein
MRIARGFFRLWLLISLLWGIGIVGWTAASVSGSAMEREFAQWRDPECRKIVLVGRISGHRRDADASGARRYI